MISFQNFSFRYEESKNFTLRGIDMTVRTGEFILLTGRSGCGKTTLIRSLNDDGTIQNQQLSPTVLKSLSEKYFT